MGNPQGTKPPQKWMTIPNAHSFESRVGFTAIRTLAIERFLENTGYRAVSRFD
jgi:hypothetical protein